MHVASFASGYVRRTKAGGYCPSWQINKRCEGEPEYFDSGRLDELGRPMYTKFTTRSCVLIPIEIDRLEYMMKYCVKNYFIKNANQVPNGDFYPKWMYDSHKNEYKNRASEVNDLQNKLATIKRIASNE